MPVKITPFLITVTVTLLAGTTPLIAQLRPGPFLAVEQAPALAVNPPILRLHDPNQPPPPDAWKLGLAGVAGSVLGSIGGAHLGYRLDREHFNWGCEHGCEDPGIWGLMGGWFLGSALTTPMSVHLANGGRGELSTAYISSALIAGAGLAGLLATGSPSGALFLVGAPLAQVISAVLIERRVAP